MKANSLNERVFAQFCENNIEHYKTLVFHTEVTWLLKSNNLERLMNIWKPLKVLLNQQAKTAQEIESKYFISVIFSLLQEA